MSELLLDGAQNLVFQAVQAEQYSDRRTEAGHAGVVRNVYQPERETQTGIGPITVKISKVRAKTGAPVTFQSALVPPYVRKTKSLEAALPWLKQTWAQEYRRWREERLDQDPWVYIWADGSQSNTGNPLHEKPGTR